MLKARLWYSTQTSADSSIDTSKAVSASGGIVAVADVQGVTVFESGKKIKSVSSKDGYSAVAVNGNNLAYGGLVSTEALDRWELARW